MSPSPLAFPQTLPELHDDAVRLRELRESDIPAWFERARDVESAFLAGDRVPQSIEAGAAWLAQARERFRARTGLRWAIVPALESQSVGSIGLLFDGTAAELGLVVARAHWGRGLGTAAARLVVRYAFDSLGVTQLRAEVLASNIASRRLLEKAGFAFARTLPDFDQQDGRALDGCLYLHHGFQPHHPPVAA